MSSLTCYFVTLKVFYITTALSKKKSKEITELEGINEL